MSRCYECGNNPCICHGDHCSAENCDKSEHLNRVRKVFTMFDNSISEALTDEERKRLTVGCMTVLLSENGDLSNLGLLLSRYENTCRKIEEQRDYHSQRADANWKALCECRKEDE